jgi:predicted porin
MADPMRANGSFAETLWPGLYTGNRFNNALRWRAKVGPIFGSLYGALGEQSTANRRTGRTSATTLGYSEGPLYAVAAMQTNRDKNDRQNKVFSAGGTYIANATTWHAAYLHAKREQGFVMGDVGESLAVSGLGLGANVPSVGGFSTDFVFAGFTRRMEGALTVKLAWYHARSKGGTLIATEGGWQQSAYAVLEYALSQRTVLEAGIDHNRWTGGWGGFWGSSAESGVAAAGNPLRNGFDTRTSVSAGLRHEF